jgi:hypothetical protein
MKLNHDSYEILILVFLTLSSCDKVIDLHLSDNSGRTVIEGNITDAQDSVNVKLTKNVPFTSTNTYPPITGANVIISDLAGNSYVLSEKPAGTYSTRQLTGLSGHSYRMTVNTNGITYTAQSTMPALVPLDSVTYRDADFFTDHRKVITVNFQDPANVVNQYRYVLYVNNIEVKEVIAYNDDFTNGRYVRADLFENDINIYKGDTVRVEMQCLDLPIYTYWFTAAQQQPNGPGGGVTPANLPSNINNGALGYFSAHTTETKVILINK